MNKKLVPILGALILLFGGNFFAAKTFAQCGTYFKLKYSAVGKIPNIDNRPFRLMDWNADGKPDFYNFRSNNATQTIDIIIYPVKPTGYWDWDNPVIYTSDVPNTTNNFQPTDFVVKDFNSDGRVDIRLNNRIYRNNGSGALVGQAPIVWGGGNWLATLGDFDLNDDGLLDWLYTVQIHPTGHEIRYQMQNPDGSFGAPVIVIAHTAQTPLNGVPKAAGDFDGDGKVDIVYAAGFNYVFIKGMSNGAFQINSAVPSNATGGYVRVADFNNDGRADILVGGASPSAFYVYYGQANSTFTQTPLILTGDSGGLDVADMNGDNYLDIVRYPFSAVSYSVTLNNGNGSFAPTVNYQRPFPGGEIVSDLSGDGKADVFYHSTGIPYVNAFGEQIVPVWENTCNSSGETRRLNFGQDPSSDLAMWTPSTGDWFYKNPNWYSPSLISFTTFNWGLGSLGDTPAPGDYDGDGRTDRAVYRSSTGVWWILQSSNSEWSVFPFGMPGDIPVPADYDGGGKTDAAVFRPSDGNWYFWFSETGQYGAVHFGVDGDKPVPQDYDGDGKTDAAVFRPSDGKWYILRSSDLVYSVIQWGIATDKPIPADYDGDLKADVAIFRNGQWWIVRSSDNQVNVINYGQAGDIPLGFYRNTVSADPLFYRPVERIWYVRWTYPLTRESFGNNGEVPIYFGLPNN